MKVALLGLMQSGKSTILSAVSGKKIPPIGSTAIEEAIVNAMIAAESMTTVKPEGYTIEAIDHDRLKQIMSRYNRLIEN